MDLNFARLVADALPDKDLRTAYLDGFRMKVNIFSFSMQFVLFKGMDLSIFRASKETLYIPFSYDTRYRAKQVADAFPCRFSRGFTALVFSAVSAVAAVPAAFYAGAGFLFSGVWLGLSFPLTAERDKVTGN